MNQRPAQPGSAWATPRSQPSDFLESTGWRHLSNSPGFFYGLMLTSEGGQDASLLHIPCRFPSFWKKALSTMNVLFCHLPGRNECGKTASLPIPLPAFIKESKNCYWLFVKPSFQNIIPLYSHEIYQRILNLGVVALRSHTVCEFCVGGHLCCGENCSFVS